MAKYHLDISKSRDYQIIMKLRFTPFIGNKSDKDKESKFQVM